MPKRYRKMKGGFLDSIGATLSGWGTSISDGASSAWNKTKNATSSAYNSATGNTTSSYTGGRKTRRHLKGGYMGNTNLALNAASFKHMKGGYTNNSNIGLTAAPVTNMKGGYSLNKNIGVTAAPVNNIKTTQVDWLGGGYAQPQWLALGGNSFVPQADWIGGKTKRRRHSKSRKSRKH